MPPLSPPTTAVFLYLIPNPFPPLHSNIFSHPLRTIKASNRVHSESFLQEFHKKSVAGARVELSLSNLPGIVWRRLSKREFAEHRSMGWFYTKRDSDRDGTGTGDN